jgi:hypothetical protein
MHATENTNNTTDVPTFQHDDHLLEHLLNGLARLDDVEIRASGASGVCTAYGCSHVDDLLNVRIDGFGKRVLCPSHATDLACREVEIPLRLSVVRWFRHA